MRVSGGDAQHGVSQTGCTEPPVCQQARRCDCSSHHSCRQLRHQGGAGADQGTPRQSAPRFCPLFPGISLHIPAQAPLKPTSAAGAENPALLQHRLDVCPSSLWLGPSSPRWLHPHLAGSILTSLAPGVQAQRGAGQSSLSAGGHCAEGPYRRGRCPKAQHHAEPPSPASPAPTAGFDRL